MRPAGTLAPTRTGAGAVRPGSRGGTGTAVLTAGTAAAVAGAGTAVLTAAASTLVASGPGATTRGPARPRTQRCEGPVAAVRAPARPQDPGAGTDVHATLAALFRAAGARHRFIPHAPEGRTDRASSLRGHPLAQAAKSIVLRVALGKRRRRYVLAVVPGDRRVDLAAVADLLGGTEASFAVRDVAERMTGSVSGSIAPFVLCSPGLEVLVDEGLTGHDEIFFNTGRLDMSVALAVSDYLALARPTVASIAER
ncbi:YbaK/EbsC family protein [Kitasatospora sp. NPDC056138]|uniref:YbaK/EbsC family protein n=1 Tax=Kitasatospora sp. NPDC056138 TaxID=3345724 RepID=UPI0035DF10E3